MLIYRKEFYLLFQSDLVRISYTPSYRCSTWALSRKIVDLHLLISADVHQPYISLFFTLQTDLLAHFWKQLFPSHLDAPSHGSHAEQTFIYICTGEMHSSA